MVGHVKKPKAEKSVIFDSEAGLDAGFESPSNESKHDAVALTIVKNPKGGYNILSVEIDSVNLTAGKVTVIGEEETRAGSVEKFKINVVKAGIV